MKISSSNTNKRFQKTRGKTDDSSGLLDTLQSENINKNRPVSAFEQLLDTTENPQNTNDEIIFALMSKLDNQSQELKDAPSITNFNEYKTIIKKLITKIIPGTFTIETSETTQKACAPVTKQFHLVKVIDHQLESLLKLIKEKEKDNMLIASQIVRIKGLIIDIKK